MITWFLAEMEGILRTWRVQVISVLESNDRTPPLPLAVRVAGDENMGDCSLFPLLFYVFRFQSSD